MTPKRRSLHARDDRPLVRLGPLWEKTVTRLSISEARRRLPELVRQIQEDPGSVVQITVRGETIAELRAAPRTALPAPEPGAAAKALLELARKLPRRRGRRRNISGHVKEYLYGRKARDIRESGPPH
jgi:antitoxin (DNA-binding transcriptional repressor) of toxin-antitoxin stability system